MGWKFSLHPYNIIDKYEREPFESADGLIQLWDDEEYDFMKDAALAAKKVPWWIKPLYWIFRTPTELPPVDLFLGIYEVEGGDMNRGYDMIEKYDEARYNYTSDLHAMFLTYQALRARDCGNEGDYVDLITEAHDSHKGSKRLNKMAANIGLITPEFGPWMDQTLYFEDALTYLEGGEGTTTLSEILNATPKNKITPLCLMPWYRGNGPYDDVLKLYGSMAPHIQDKLAPIVVVTGETEKRADRKFWYETEEKLLRMGRPIHLLHDHTQTYLDKFHLRGSPRLLFVDSSGKVIWDKPMNSAYDYWDMLAKSAAP